MRILTELMSCIGHPCSTIQGSLADPDLHKRGGQIFDEIFERLFLGISRKNFSIPEKIPHLSPKISDDLFLVIDLFRVLHGIFPWGAKSVANIATGGGPKS